MSILIGQELEMNKDGSVVLFNKMNNDYLLKDNYELRKENGKARGANLKPVCSLDVVWLSHEPTGKGRMVLEARSGTPEFRIALRDLLLEYPTIRTSDLKI